MDSTSIKANTKFNNPKSFSKNKFSKDNQHFPLLTETNNWFSLEGVNFMQTKAMSLKSLQFYNKCISKNHNLTDDGHVVCDAVILMIKYGKKYFDGFIKQKHYCKYYKSKDDCHHTKYFNGKKYRSYIKYTIISTDYRSSINRDQCIN